MDQEKNTSISHRLSTAVESVARLSLALYHLESPPAASLAPYHQESPTSARQHGFMSKLERGDLQVPAQWEQEEDSRECRTVAK